MPRFHRYYLSNHPVFITCVTRDRKPLLAKNEEINFFRKWLKEGYYEQERGTNGEPDGILGIRYE
jgi:REP element-mobilizing transposase RayT